MVPHDDRKAMSTLWGRRRCGGAQKAKRAGAASTNLAKSQKQARVSGVVVSVGGQCGKIVEEVNSSRLASGKHFYFLSGAKDRIVLCYTIKQSRDMTGFILKIGWKLLKPCKPLLLNVSLDIFLTLQIWATCLNFVQDKIRESGFR